MRRSALVTLCGAVLLAGSAAYAGDVAKQDNAQCQRGAGATTGNQNFATGPKQSATTGAGQFRNVPKAKQEAQAPCRGNLVGYDRDRAMYQPPQATWADKDGVRSKIQANDSQQIRLMRSLLRMNTKDREAFIDTLKSLEPEQRTVIGNAFGIDRWDQAFQTIFPVQPKTISCERPGKASVSPNTANTKTQNQNAPTAVEDTSIQGPTSQSAFANDRHFLSMIEMHLQDPATLSLDAVHKARAYLTPHQRIRFFRPVLSDASGSPEMRNAAYLVLIDAFRELGEVDQSVEIAKKMVAETTGEYPD